MTKPTKTPTDTPNAQLTRDERKSRLTDSRTTPEAIHKAVTEVLTYCEGFVSERTITVLQEMQRRNRPLDVPPVDSPREVLLAFMVEEIKRHPARTVTAVSKRVGWDKNLVFDLLTELVQRRDLCFRRINVYEGWEA